MTFTSLNLPVRERDGAVNKIIKLASFAVGGQGGGVLNSWIVNLAERNDFDVQATSVAGVAQRTGATMYYVEMLPRTGAQPVFSLAPSEGDVNILLASELMEAGRAIMRKFVTPGKTNVIVSTHRQLATVEKMVPGDGEANGDAVLVAVKEQANKCIAHNFQRISEEAGTVISASLFGALAGSQMLPFPTESFRETIRDSGRGVDRSLAAFEMAYAVAAGEIQEELTATVEPDALMPAGPDGLLADFALLTQRVDDFPEPVAQLARLGLRKVVEFQDIAYGETYLNYIEQALALDNAKQNYAYTCSLAKYLANAMAYDDLIRVAVTKTHPTRRNRIEKEIRAEDRHLTKVTEYTHPGAAEVISIMPRLLGRTVQTRPALVKILDKLVNRGRRIRTDRVGGFLSFYVLAGLKKWRRKLYRHENEWAHIEAWRCLAERRLTQDYDFAVATLRTRRLIKGYSDTHARGLSKFDKVIAGSRLLELRQDAALWTQRMIDAALADVEGKRLDDALITIRSSASDGYVDSKGSGSITTA